MLKHLSHYKNIILFIPVMFLFKYGYSQSTFERMGQKAMMDGNFTVAANYFEKAYTSEGSNLNVLWLMGYSNFHAGEFKKSIDAFDKLIDVKPAETAAYYYRGKAKISHYANSKELKYLEKEKLLLSAIKDFSNAINLSSTDMKLYQNRGLAYQEFGIFKSQKVGDTYNRTSAINALSSSITDFQKVIDENGARRDILAQIEKSKQLLIDLRSN